MPLMYFHKIYDHVVLPFIKILFLTKSLVQQKSFLNEHFVCIIIFYVFIIQILSPVKKSIQYNYKRFNYDHIYNLYVKCFTYPFRLFQQIERVQFFDQTYLSMNWPVTGACLFVKVKVVWALVKFTHLSILISVGILSFVTWICYMMTS